LKNGVKNGRGEELEASLTQFSFASLREEGEEEEESKSLCWNRTFG